MPADATTLLALTGAAAVAVRLTMALTDLRNLPVHENYVAAAPCGSEGTGLADAAAAATAPEAGPPIPFDTPQAFLDEALSLFQQLIRADTSNPPGQEEALANNLKEMLEAAGLEVKVFDQHSPNEGSTRRSLVARLPGAAPESADLLLSGHLDVVSVNRSAWTKEPFGAEISNDQHGTPCVWGRGAADMKARACCALRSAHICLR